MLTVAVAGLNLESLLRDLASSASSVILSKVNDPSYKRIIRANAGDVTRGIDWLAEGAIIDRLRAENINAVVITEERGIVNIGDNPEYVFIVDPLDGSLNFVLDVPFYSVSIAVAKYSREISLSDILAGVVYQVTSGIAYYAEKGRGAFINGERASFDESVLDKPVASIYIEPTVDVKLFEGLSRLYRALGGFKIRSLGAASLEVIMASLGKLLFFLDVRNRLRLYDIAASYVFAREAGAIIDVVGGGLDKIPLTQQPRLSLLVTRNPKVAELIFSNLRISANAY